MIRIRFRPSRALLVSCLLVMHVSVRAQGGAQQVVNDAAAALGGKERLLALKTLQFEGGGHDFQVDQEFAYDELGSQFLAYQLRDNVGPWNKFLGVLQCNGHSS